jgi:hypothetical protein
MNRLRYYADVHKTRKNREGSKNLVGLFKPIRGRKKIYSRYLRKALQRLTSSINNIPSFQLTARMEKAENRERARQYTKAQKHRE